MSAVQKSAQTAVTSCGNQPLLHRTLSRAPKHPFQDPSNDQNTLRPTGSGRLKLEPFVRQTEFCFVGMVRITTRGREGSPNAMGKVLYDYLQSVSHLELDRWFKGYLSAGDASRKCRPDYWGCTVFIYTHSRA